MSITDYGKLVRENVTKNYKKAPEDSKESINVEALTFVTKLKLDDRVQAYSTNESFVTIKDHKENFYTNSQCRLINPAKTQMGRISNKMLENIVNEIKIQSELNDQSVLSWFSTIEKDKSSKFIQFDIESFYP